MHPIPNTQLQSFPIAYGCMSLSQVSSHTDRVKIIEAALETGINVFDHADIYGAGECERMFGRILSKNSGLREQMVLQSKCGIRFAGDTYGDASPSRYDFSKQHILRAAEGSLQRLGIEQLDILLLHRPDLLMEPDEVAQAFAELKSAGKVRYFGVSNFDRMQIQLLQQALDAPLVVNQIQLSLLHNGLIAQGAKVNLKQDYSGTTGTLDYCRAENIGLQAWSPLAGRQFFSASDQSPQHMRAAVDYTQQLAEQKSVSVAAILLAWILRHPAKIIPVIGTTKPSRLRDAARAVDVNLSRDEWYGLLEKAEGTSVP